jgi:hypothetical protein
VNRLNVGNLDRVLRILLGLVLIGLAAGGTIGGWGYAGIVLVLTGIAASCPIYRIFGLSTTSR